MPINFDKWDVSIGNVPQGNAGVNAGAGKAVEHVKIDDYSEALKSVGDTALPISERMEAVEELTRAVTGEEWGCVESEYFDLGTKGKTVCVEHGYLSVREFKDAPSSPYLFILNFASLFGSDTVRKVRYALMRENINVEELLSSSKGAEVTCEVDESFHYKSEIICTKG